MSYSTSPTAPRVGSWASLSRSLSAHVQTPLLPAASPLADRASNPLRGAAKPALGPPSDAFPSESPPFQAFHSPEIAALKAGYGATVPVLDLPASGGVDNAGGGGGRGGGRGGGGSGSGSMSAGGTAEEAHRQRVLAGYKLGQLSSVVKLGVWWCFMGPLVLGVFRGDPYGVAGMRAAFNTGMFFVSPLAGLLTQRFSARALLTWTAATRGLVYGVVLPLLYVVLESGWVLDASEHLRALYYAIFLVLLLVDGCTMAVSNVVDLDCGGEEVVAAQYRLRIPDAVRSAMRALHEGFFEGSMILLAPLVAACAYVAARAIDGASHEVSVVAVWAGLSAVFFVATFVSVSAYQCSLRHASISMARGGVSGAGASGSEGGGGDFARRACPEVSVAAIVLALADGFKVCAKNRAVWWRLVFLSLETAFEDLIISLLIAEFTTNGLERRRNYALGNLWCAGIVACGKVGAVLSARFMHRSWETTDASRSPASAGVAGSLTATSRGEPTSAQYGPLFLYTFIGGVATLLLPIALHLLDDRDSRVASVLVAFASAFLYFFFSTPPKLGFSVLLQGLVAETDASGRVFAFVAAFLTVVDSVVLLLGAVVFTSLRLQGAMWLVCCVFATLCLLQLLVGPRLILARAQVVGVRHERHGGAEDEDDER
jgi:hypothetical protein